MTFEHEQPADEHEATIADTDSAWLEHASLTDVTPTSDHEVPVEIAYVVPPDVINRIATDDVPVVDSVESVSPLSLAVQSLEASLSKRLDALQSVFDREIRAEATREKVVDRLHSELQDYKNDLVLTLMKPVFVDLIQLHDDIGKIVSAQAETSGDAAKMLDLMKGFQQGIEDILYRQGVEAFEIDDDNFDPRKQRAFSTQITEDIGLNKKIAARLRKGFKSGDKIVRPEIVSVFAVKR
jgi:molecular chaperone GrpE